MSAEGVRVKETGELPEVGGTQETLPADDGRRGF